MPRPPFVRGILLFRIVRATPPRQSYSAQAPHSLVAWPQAVPDSSAPPCRAGSPRCAAETLPATKPVSDSVNTVESGAAAPRPRRPDRPPSSTSADETADYSPHKSRSRLCPAPVRVADLFAGLSAL